MSKLSLTKVPGLQQNGDEVYENGEYRMVREIEGETPNGNRFGGRWVLRKNGEYIDVDQYRHDLAPRYGFELE